MTYVDLTAARAYVRAALAALHAPTAPLARRVRVQMAVGLPVAVVVFGACLALLPGRGPFDVALAAGAAIVASEAVAVAANVVDRRRPPAADATLLPAAPAGVDPVDAALRRMRDHLEETVSAHPEPEDDSRRQALASARTALARLTVAINRRSGGGRP
ncbi:MAG: hypothetical protein FWJ87_07895 [Micromonosporaceae bacterium]